MKKVFLIILSLFMLSVSAFAGFWSSALGTAAGNSLNSPTKAQANTVKYYKDKDATKEPKKVQQVLSKLGFYNGSFEGNLNSFDTRDSIEQFQSYYSLKETGVINEMEKADLLYMHDLIKNYKKELKKPGTKDTKRLLKIYKAFDKLENKLSKNNLKKDYLTTKFKQEIAERRKYLANKKEKAELAKIKKKKEYEEFKKRRLKVKDVYKDASTGRIWQDESINRFKKLKFKQASFYCKNLILNGSTNWRLPTFDELKTLYQNNPRFNYKTLPPKYSNWNTSIMTKTSTGGMRLKNVWIKKDRYSTYASGYKGDPYHFRCIKG